MGQTVKQWSIRFRHVSFIINIVDDSDYEPSIYPFFAFFSLLHRGSELSDVSIIRRMRGVEVLAFRYDTI